MYWITWAHQVIMRVRRPFYVINSQIMVEDGLGNVVGEVFQRFHLLKRNSDLYLDKAQFATIQARARCTAPTRSPSKPDSAGIAQSLCTHAWVPALIETRVAV